MAKMKNTNKRKIEKPQKQIDYIPKCCKQPRSRSPKPRTDFSLFVCSTSSSTSTSSSSPLLNGRLCNRGSMMKISSCKDGFSTITTASMYQGCQASFSRCGKGMPKLLLAQCNMSQNGAQGLFSNSLGVPVTDLESVEDRALLGIVDDRDVEKPDDDASEALEFTPTNSETTENYDIWISPGSLVWAKTACQMWWPAEIMGERSTPVSPSNQGVDGHVLVQYYGNHEHAWVDPARDLSQFENYFQERSCNPIEEFQNALKQALHRKEHVDSCRLLGESPDGFKSSLQEDQSSDKWNSSSSSRTGRGKRKRKPKVHFDEVALPVKSVKKLRRRLRIMRYLGLTAPIGSPFSLTSI